MDLAIKKARAWGVAIVGVRNSSHFGASGFYSMRALAADMIGIAMTNLGAQVIARPPGGQVKMLGTNPLSISAPAAALPPFSLDMSTTVVSTGRLRTMAQSRRPVPAGWIVDDDDNDVTDASRFFENSAHLQMLGGKGSAGGYKGYGLGLAVDILAGLLTGAHVGPDPRLLEPVGLDRGIENIGHMFLAIDIARFRPINEFRQAMDRMLGALLHNPARESGDPVLYPGYPEAVAGQQSLPNGVAIAEDDIVSLSRLGDELGVRFPKVVWRNELPVSDSLEMRSA
jgi:LDH2 family malate/lactate/ureidoglycolate dehydrogenase